MTSPDSIARILPSDLPAVTTLTSGVNAIADTVQTALTNNYLRKTSGNVVNADINAGAAIAYSKLNLATSIVNADINAAAAIVGTKIATGTITSTNILDGTIVNADINAGAAINSTKVSAVPYCLAYRAIASGSQNFGSANGTVLFSTAIDNTGSMWAGGAPSRVTILSTGWYRVVMSGTLSGTGITTDGWAVFKNGVSGISQGTGANYTGEAGAFSLTAADYLEILWVRVAGTGCVTTATNGVPLNPGNPSGAGGNFGALLVQYLGA